jgi:hypothetical protein
MQGELRRSHESDPRNEQTSAQESPDSDRALFVRLSFAVIGLVLVETWQWVSRNTTDRSAP